MATCEACGEYLKQKLAPTHESDDLIDITFFPAQDADERSKSVPRNYYCSVECAIEGLRERQPQEATREQWERRAELEQERKERKERQEDRA